MRSDSLDCSSTSSPKLGVYECEIHLKFRLVEEKGAFVNRDQLLELLLDAFSYGSDEYMEPTHVEVAAQEICELSASPQMRRQLIRLRNSSDGIQ
ncbi:Npun_R1517 family heterocyst differentiation transcriptional regulator [Phormidium sp. CLA17]|uniref:Npun_R1517 family heterocyst differentiation transcriptional regulator n=1 Tax=Leptolyngbya sp. Cla-17 TaxID=2803751 RepID=UPI00149119A7|nr:Npun_R1517 family heterocyst differentiation transcriptional regulator [Leptolyngbya sp. Cla-17]MBM0742221.1 Npun_R1517 family heterocyst differentiation transcriptional regulator [Leptolyngbya sp. Cla-17]